MMIKKKLVEYRTLYFKELEKHYKTINELFFVKIERNNLKTEISICIFIIFALFFILMFKLIGAF